MKEHDRRRAAAAASRNTRADGRRWCRACRPTRIVVSQHAVLRVEHHDAELLDRPRRRYCGSRNAASLPRRRSCGRSAVARVQRPAAELDGRQHLRGPRAADAAHRAQIVGATRVSPCRPPRRRAARWPGPERRWPREPLPSTSASSSLSPSPAAPRRSSFSRGRSCGARLSSILKSLCCCSRHGAARGCWLLVVLFVSRAPPPHKEIDRRPGAIDAARAAGAERYAPPNHRCDQGAQAGQRGGRWRATTASPSIAPSRAVSTPRTRPAQSADIKARVRDDVQRDHGRRRRSARSSGRAHRGSRGARSDAAIRGATAWHRSNGDAAKSGREHYGRQIPGGRQPRDGQRERPSRAGDRLAEGAIVRAVSETTTVGAVREKCADDAARGWHARGTLDCVAARRSTPAASCLRGEVRPSR